MQSGRVTWVLATLFVGLHVVLAAAMPWTPDEPTYLKAGQLLSADLNWSTINARLHGPLPFYANHIAAHLGLGDPNEPSYRTLGRLGMLVFPFAAAAIAFAWTRRLANHNAANWLLAIWCLHPVLLAHGPLMATDMSLVPFWLLALFSTWAFLTKPRRWHPLVIGFALGCGLATKYLGLFLVPVLGLTLGLALLRGFAPRFVMREASGLLARTADAGLVATVVAVVAWGTLWLCYGFRPSGYDSAAIEPMSAFFAEVRTLPLSRQLLLLLPEGWVRGVDYMKYFSESGGQAFLLGHLQPGFAAYYVTALLTLTPLALLVLLAVGAIRPGLPRYAGITLVLGCLVPLLYLSLAQALQIGLRHMLQVVPLLCIMMARGADLLASRRLGRVALAGIGASLLWFHGAAAPHYVGAFNDVVGDRPDLWFRDNNLSWISVTHSPDPFEQRIRERLPGAQRVYANSGPRLGRVIVHAEDLKQRSHPDGSMAHWLEALTPTVVERAWLGYEIEPEDLADPIDRAIALVSASRADEARGALQEAVDTTDPRVPALLQCMTSLESDRVPPVAQCTQLMILGRFDQVADNERAARWQRARSLLERNRPEAARDALTISPNERGLAVQERLVLAVACDLLQDYDAGLDALTFSAEDADELEAIRESVDSLRDKLTMLAAEARAMQAQLPGGD